MLVVDDEPAMVELISSLLTMDGHRVSTTGDGREAMRRVEDQINRLDLIITDIKMPGVSGERLYRRACQLRPWIAKRVIFTTGDTASPETRELVELSGNVLLAKPFRIDELRRAIGETLGRPA